MSNGFNGLVIIHFYVPAVAALKFLVAFTYLGNCPHKIIIISFFKTHSSVVDDTFTSRVFFFFRY